MENNRKASLRYEAGNYAPLAPARKRVATTSPGLLAKFQSPVSISNGPDKSHQLDELAKFRDSFPPELLQNF